MNLIYRPRAGVMILNGTTATISVTAVLLLSSGNDILSIIKYNIYITTSTYT